MPTIKDVAQLAKVSTATVSNVLSGNRFVSDGLREAVMQAVEALDYRPNVVARNLKTQRTQTIGVLVPDITNPFFNRLVGAIDKAAAEAGYQLLLASCEENPAKERKRVDAFLRSQVDGLIITPTEDVPEYLSFLLASKTATVILDRGVTELDIDSVVANNRESAREATKHLLDLGHRNVAFVGGNPQLENMRQRKQGFLETLAEAGLRPAPHRLVETQSSVAAARKAVLELLKEDGAVTAIFAGNNRLTLGAIQAIRELDLPFPEGISMVGFDDFEWTTALKPYLTTIAQPTEAMGKRAWTLLARRLQGSTEPPQHAVLSCSLCVRESTRTVGREELTYKSTA